MITKLEQFKNTLILEKTENQSYSSGCLMGFFDEPFKKIKINNDDLYDNDDNEYGEELEYHVTILYGLDDKKVNEDELCKLMYLINCPEIKTNEISLFENEKYDVVKFEVESEDLTILNKMICSMFPYKSDFPDYKAHQTIAYCISGKGKSYIEKFDKPLKKKISFWEYSKADGKKIKIIPGVSIETIREAVKNESKKESEQKDESFEYKGYTVNLTPNTGFKNAYNCSVYLKNEYKMGLRGPCSLDAGKDAAIYFIDGQISHG